MSMKGKVNIVGLSEDCKDCVVSFQFDKLYKLFTYALVTLIIISLGDKLGTIFLNVVEKFLK